MKLYDSIVITGGGGMLAHALDRQLHARGFSATLLDRAAADITSESDVQRLFARHHPSLLLNCAAHTKVDLCEQQPDLANAINGHAVGLLGRIAREHGTMLVHFSTDFVFDGRSTRPYRPNDPVNPLSAYGRSKLLGEQELQRHATRWLLIRTAWLYGTGGASFPRTMVERGRAGQPLRVVNDQIGSPTYADDLAAATLDLLETQATGIWHLANSGAVSWFDFARAILEAFDVKASIEPTTSAEWFKIRPNSAVRPAYSVLDAQAFAQRVDRPMRPWQEALRDFAERARASGFTSGAR